MSLVIQNGVLSVTTRDNFSVTRTFLETRTDGIGIQIGDGYSPGSYFDVSLGGLDTLLPTARITLTGGTINVRNLPTYADNAAALTGGLGQDDLYKTSSGELRIVYTL